MTDRILVTGATGFIGSAVCRALVARGRHVRVLRRTTSSLAALEGLPVEQAVGDILQPESLPAAMQDVDLLFHVASQAAYWRKPEEVVRVAVEGTRHIMQAAVAAGVRRAVLTSSLAAMGLPTHDELLTEDHTFNLPPHRFPYGYAKRQAELEALRVGGSQMEVVIVNPSVVLGPGDLNQISGSLVIEAARGRTVFWTEGGINAVHVEDVAHGHLAAAERGRPGERYLLGGENLSHLQVFSILDEVVGRSTRRVKLPTPLVPLAASLVDFLGRFVRLPLDGNQLRLSRYNIYCDTRRARQALSLPKPRSFRQSAEDAYRWYCAEGIL